MTLEEYNQLDADFAHCSGEHCKQANECLTPHRPHYAYEQHTKLVYDNQS